MIKNPQISLACGELLNAVERSRTISQIGFLSAPPRLCVELSLEAA
jgi:hypothetical protein